MADIALLVRIRATPAEVFQRVATTAGIAEWFTDAASSEYCAGGKLELRFPGETMSFDVTDLTEPSRIVWRCTTRDNSWFDADIAFDFVPDGDRTHVRFDHTGWPEVSDRFRDCSMSWAYFLESLRALLEEGQGTPEGVAPACESTPAL
jgi:uncharacterized protein YndB with AHSA1/START domain